MKNKFFSFLVLGIVILFSLTACNSSSNFQSSPIATEVVPTFTPTPSPSISGVLTNAETGEPIAGARLALCQQNDATTCAIKLDLTAITND